MKSKADRFELEAIQMQKCNRSDLNNLSDKLGILQQEISQVMVLLNENLKLHLIKANDTVKAKHNRSLELMSQIHAMAG